MENTIQSYPIIGVQFPIDNGITTEVMIWLMKQTKGQYFDFLRIDGEYSSAYFSFGTDVYAELEERCLLQKFEELIIDILDDMDLESENCEYQFDDYTFWFGYEPYIFDRIYNFIFRELNVDGCGGNAEVHVYFPEGLAGVETLELKQKVSAIKAEEEDIDTDTMVFSALEYIKQRYNKDYQIGNIKIIEF